MATEKTINARMQMKTDTALNWSKAINFIPKKGEIIIYEADSDYGYERMKIGDGSTKVNDLPFVIGAKDWNQNDSTASDYIKNRPGGYTVNYPALNIEWDGVIGDRVSVNIGEGTKFVKVSDEIPKAEQLVGGTFTVKDGNASNTSNISDDIVHYIGDGIYGSDQFVVVNKAPANFVHPNTGAVVAVFQETGVYFTYMDDGDVVVYVSSLVLPAMSRIVPIPQEYVEGLEETTANANQALETLTKDGNPGDVLVKTETGSAWQSFVEDMIEEDMLPAVKVGSDILGINNDILMM